MLSLEGSVRSTKAEKEGRAISKSGKHEVRQEKTLS
jgi:hypothetical protein